MRKLKWLGLISILIATVVYASGGIKTFTEDVLRFGSSGAGVRKIVFDKTPDGNSAEISVDPATEEFSFDNEANFTSIVVASTSKGSIPCPKMTEAQRDALGSLVDGQCVYVTDRNQWQTYNGAAATWIAVGGGAGGSRLNLLEDGSFEISADEDAGTCTSCTASQEQTVILAAPFNENSLELAFTASSGEFFINKNTSAQFANIQGVVSCWIKTDQAGLDFIPRVDGVDLTSMAVDISSANQWKEYIIPIVSGTTSVGYKVDATSSITGSIFVDECYVGPMPGSMTPEVSQAQIAVEAYFAGTTNCTGWTNSTATLSPLATDVDCPGPTIVTNELGLAQTTDVNLPEVTVNSLPAGVYKATFIAPLQIASGNILGVAINDGTTTCHGAASHDSATRQMQTFSCTFSYTQAGNRSFELYAASNGASTVTLNNGTAAIVGGSGVKFILEYFPPKSKIYSDKQSINSIGLSGNDARAITATTESIPFDGTGFGWTSGADGSTLTNGNYYTVQKSNSIIYIDLGVVASTNAVRYINIYKNGAAGKTLTSYSAQNVYRGGYVSYEGEFAVGDKISFSPDTALTLANGATHYLRIVERPNSLVVGTFKDVVTTPGSSNGKPVNYSARVSGAGVVSNEVGDLINGNCTNATPIVCTFTSSIFSAAPNCSVTQTNAHAVNCAVGITVLPTTSAVSIGGLTPAGSSACTPNATYNIDCHGVQ
jgi:hypothetical protein